MRRWIGVAALAAMLVLPGYARAQNVTEGTTTPNVSGPIPYHWDGTRMRRATGTAGGVPNFTEALPGFLQESASTTVSGDTLQVGEQNFANPLTATANTLSTASAFSPTGPIVWVRIKCTGITSGYPWSVRFYGSRDGTNYAPLMRSMYYWRSPAYGVGAATADDTLKITRRAPTGANGNWYPLQVDGLDLVARQIIAVCSNDSGTATVGTTATFTVEFAQRKR